MRPLSQIGEGEKLAKALSQQSPRQQLKEQPFGVDWLFKIDLCRISEMETVLCCWASKFSTIIDKIVK